MASAPEVVADYLRARAARHKAHRTLNEGDATLEMALLSRNHALIDIALAQYCYYWDTARSLFFKECESCALKIAVLANQVIGGRHSDFQPNELFANDSSLLGNYLAQATDEEFYALFENPSLDDSFLRDFLEGRACWLALTEAQQQLAIDALTRNERMKAAYRSKTMDGYAEYSYGAVFDAAWRLAGNVPVTNKWASRLQWLYEKLQPDAFSVENPLEQATRWIATEPADIESEGRDVAYGFLSSYQGVRKGLARLALAKNSALNATFLVSDDVAFRAAAYSDAYLSVEDIKAAFDKDGKLAFEHFLDNQQIWRKEPTRQALREIAWAIVDADSHSDLLPANIFNDYRERHAKANPEWFKDDEEFAPKPDQIGATQADLEQLSVRLEKPMKVLETITVTLGTINTRLGFVWWFALGALVASIWR